MGLRNTQDEYGAVAKGFHWAVALLVIGVICAGLYMVNLDLSPAKLQIYALHKSVGITILVLVALRLVWRFSNAHPAALPTHRPWEKILARIVHALLYLSLFLMPLSGWVMSSAKGFSVSVFDLFTLPDLVRPDEALAKQAVLVHKTVAYTLIVMIGLHLAGALKHHVIDRDKTLRRMLPFGRAR